MDVRLHTIYFLLRVATYQYNRENVVSMSMLSTLADFVFRYLAAKVIIE